MVCVCVLTGMMRRMWVVCVCSHGNDENVRWCVCSHRNDQEKVGGVCVCLRTKEAAGGVAQCALFPQQERE